MHGPPGSPPIKWGSFDVASEAVQTAGAAMGATWVMAAIVVLVVAYVLADGPSR